MSDMGADRRQARKEKVKAERLELFVSDYVKSKYNNIYNEAQQYHDMLRQKNPYKLDLKKTAEYRKWASQQVDEKPQQADEQPQQFRDNFQLKIQLMDSTQKEKPTSTAVTVQLMDSIQKEKPTSTAEALETLMEETIAEGNIQPSLLEEISADLIDEIIEELRQYPELENIYEELDIGMDVEISDDDRLEKELL